MENWLWALSTLTLKFNFGQPTHKYPNEVELNEKVFRGDERESQGTHTHRPTPRT